MRIALAQLNPTVGDVAGNTALVIDAIEHAKRDAADVLVTSELVLIGYPPRDLLLRQGVVEACELAVRQIAERADNIWVIVGHPRRVAGGTRPLRNSASICHAGRVIAVCDKQLLPGYDVFDEDRYFDPGGRSLALEIAGRRTGVVICEDLWRAEDVTAERRYAIEPAAELSAQNCEIIISLNASPFVLGKWQRHVEQMSQIARDLSVPVVAVNQVGANDDLVFDGRSLVVDSGGRPAAVLPGFRSAVEVVDVPLSGTGAAAPARAAERNGADETQRWAVASREIFHALVLGLRDYFGKTGHEQAIIGLSGGIDSAVAAVLAAAALGPGKVRGVTMPSKFSSRGSIDDSRDLARRLGLQAFDEISIRTLHAALIESLEPLLPQIEGSVADENVQSRLRGILLMAVSNANSRSLVISTSNKSEIATGYSTLYGDMCGAVAPLGDLTKTRIYELAGWINANSRECGFAGPPIPDPCIAKPPSAELRPNQTDQDTLPPYELLDDIVERYIDREQSIEAIVATSRMDEALVRRTAAMIDRAQYKRDQAPVILKVTGRAFGRGRPMPIVMKQSATGSGRPVVDDPSVDSAPGRDGSAQADERLLAGSARGKARGRR